MTELTPTDILLSGEFSDLLFTPNDSSEVLKFHRLMLTSRSTIFKTMLEDTKNNEVKLDYKLTTLKHVRSLIYTNKLDKKTSVLEVWDVYLFAQQYRFQTMIKHVDDQLSDTINNANYVDLLLLLKMMEVSSYGKSFIIEAVVMLVDCMDNSAFDLQYCKSKTTCCKHRPDADNYDKRICQHNKYAKQPQWELCCWCGCLHDEITLLRHRSACFKLLADMKTLSESTQNEIMYQVWSYH